MKKKIVLAATILLLASGCGKIPALSNGDEAVVTFKNGDKISVNELYNEVKDSYALKSLVTMIDKHILEKEYKDKLDEAKEYAKSTIDAMKEQYGGEKDLLEAIQYYTGLASIEQYEEQIYLGYLQNLAIEAYAKEQITDKQINKYYEDSIYGDVEVSHILITPNVTDDMDEDAKKAAEEDAKNKAKDIIKSLKEAKKNKEDIKETFAKLAKENSQDENTSKDGGSLGYVNYGTLSSDYNNLLDAAYKLKNNEFSTEVVTTSLGYHVILRTAIKDKAALKDVKDSIINTLKTNLINDDASISITALQNIRKEYGLEITDSELQKQYANYIQNNLAKAQSNE